MQQINIGLHYNLITTFVNPQYIDIDYIIYAGIRDNIEAFKS